MREPHRAEHRRFRLADVALAATIGVVVVILGLLSGRGDGTARAINVTIDSRAIVRPIPDGFLGLSLEYRALEAYAGTDPQRLDPIFLQLIRNLAPGQRPQLRIGGDSADWTWWPLPGVTRPPGVTFTLDQRWIDVARSLAHALDAHLLLGVNLEAGNPELAATEARVLADGIGRRSVDAFELGNEPELYGSFAWYRTPSGRAVTGRPHGYDFAAFTREFSKFAAALPRLGIAGPTVTGPSWTAKLARFLADEPLLTLVTLHRYPLQLCFTRRDSPRYPTIANLLAPAASTGLADHFATSVATAHRDRLPLRIDELNTVSCGADAKVSQTFASALWVLDALFEMARVGVDGVDIHTFPGAGYELFQLRSQAGAWSGRVAPEYYGLLMFARASPRGAELARASVTHVASLKVWATRAPDGSVRVVLINKGARSRTVAVRVTGAAGAAAALERMTAPSVEARSRVALRPAGTVSVSGGRYVVAMPAASAALLTIG